MLIKAVLDTNVFIAALRSMRGASFQILQMLRQGLWQLALSNHLLHEYEEIGKRHAPEMGLSLSDLDAILDALCVNADKHSLSHGWRPELQDPDDEPLLQLAVESGATIIVTHNVRHLRPASRFGILVLTPSDFLKKLRGEK